MVVYRDGIRDDGDASFVNGGLVVGMIMVKDDTTARGGSIAAANNSSAAVNKTVDFILDVCGWCVGLLMCCCGCVFVGVLMCVFV